MLGKRPLLETDALNSENLRSLALYVSKQLDSLFPSEGLDLDLENISHILPSTIARLSPILGAAHCFKDSLFEYYNSLQYATFLYLLANEQWRRGFDAILSERLFCLNKALNSIDLYYSVQLPEVFLISHGVGSVIGNAQYGDRLVVFQNVTVGRIGKLKPVIGENVVIYPGATITGKSVVGNNCVISAGTILHNVIVPDNTIARLDNGKLTFQENRRDYVGLYLRSKTATE